MGSEEIALVLTQRKVLGKQVKHLRHDGQIPAVIHDHGQPSKVVMAPSLEMLKVYKTAGKTHPLNLTLGKENFMALIKDVDFDPKKHKMRHVVFNAIKQDEKVETEVPVRLTGEIPAEKAGLMVITNQDTVEIEALPKDLVDELVVDGRGLAEIGDKVHVSDIEMPAGITILTDPELVVAAVEETKQQISEETEEEVEGEEGAEGEEGEAGTESEGEGKEDKTKESGEDE